MAQLNIGKPVRKLKSAIDIDPISRLCAGDEMRSEIIWPWQSRTAISVVAGFARNPGKPMFGRLRNAPAFKIGSKTIEIARCDIDRRIRNPILIELGN